MGKEIDEVRLCMRNSWSVLVVGGRGFGKTQLLRSLDGIYVEADSPKRMLDSIAYKVGVKPSRSISGTVFALRPALKGKVLLVDDCNLMAKAGLRAISRLGTTFVAASTKKVLLPYRVVVKLKRKSLEESVSIARSMCELSDEEAKAVARRANGVPGTIRTLCDDVMTARKLGIDPVRFVEEAPLPKTLRINTVYLMLGFASTFLAMRYVFYHYELYDPGYMVAILAYIIYGVVRFRRVAR